MNRVLSKGFGVLFFLATGLTAGSFPTSLEARNPCETIYSKPGSTLKSYLGGLPQPYVESLWGQKIPIMMKFRAKFLANLLHRKDPVVDPDPSATLSTWSSQNPLSILFHDASVNTARTIESLDMLYNDPNKFFNDDEFGKAVKCWIQGFLQEHPDKSALRAVDWVLMRPVAVWLMKTLADEYDFHVGMTPSMATWNGESSTIHRITPDFRNPDTLGAFQGEAMPFLSFVRLLLAAYIDLESSYEKPIGYALFGQKRVKKDMDWQHRIIDHLFVPEPDMVIQQLTQFLEDGLLDILAPTTMFAGGIRPNGEIVDEAGRRINDFSFDPEKGTIQGLTLNGRSASEP